jgi:hypothetical protein
MIEKNICIHCQPHHSFIGKTFYISEDEKIYCFRHFYQLKIEKYLLKGDYFTIKEEYDNKRRKRTKCEHPEPKAESQEKLVDKKPE